MRFLNNVDFTGNELRNAVVQNLPTTPQSPSPGALYYDTTLKCLRYYTGTGWINVVPAPGAFTPKGSWNASNNTPALVSGQGSMGDIYTVSVAGTTVLDGFNSWDVGDAVFYDGFQWIPIDNTVYVTQAQFATKASKMSQDVGDGTSLAIVITHNFNTRDVVVVMRSNTDPYAAYTPAIEMTTANSVTLRFSTPPTTAQYRVTIMG